MHLVVFDPSPTIEKQVNELLEMDETLSDLSKQPFTATESTTFHDGSSQALKNVPTNSLGPPPKRKSDTDIPGLNSPELKRQVIAQRFSPVMNVNMMPQYETPQQDYGVRRSTYPAFSHQQGHSHFQVTKTNSFEDSLFTDLLSPNPYPIPIHPASASTNISSIGAQSSLPETGQSHLFITNSAVVNAPSPSPKYSAFRNFAAAPQQTPPSRGINHLIFQHGAIEDINKVFQQSPDGIVVLSSIELASALQNTQLNNN